MPAVLLPLWSRPFAACGVALAWVRRRGQADEHCVEAALDRLLGEQSAALRRKPPADPLRLCTVEWVQLPARGFGLGVRSGGVDLVRVIRGASPSSYRLRLRAFARVTGGRTLVRSIDVDLPRA